MLSGGAKRRCIKEGSRSWSSPVFTHTHSFDNRPSSAKRYPSHVFSTRKPPPNPFTIMRFIALSIALTAPLVHLASANFDIYRVGIGGNGITGNGEGWQVYEAEANCDNAKDWYWVDTDDASGRVSAANAMAVAVATTTAPMTLMFSK